MPLSVGAASGVLQIDRNGDAYVQVTKGAKSVSGNCRVDTAPGFRDTVSIADSVQRASFQAFDILMWEGWSKLNGFDAPLTLFGKGSAVATKEQIKTVATFSQNVSNTCVAIPEDLRYVK